MKIVLATLLPIALGACEAPVRKAEVDYRPEQAGTVDHALCLLGFTAVPLRETRGTGHHLVAAKVNGREGVFVLDTGANLSVIDVDHAERFKVASTPGWRAGAVGVGGGQRAQQIRIASLELGGIRIRQRNMILTDLGQLGDALAPLAGGAVHGIIGQDALKEHRAVIDMEKPILYLIAADEDPAPVPAERCGAAG